MIQLQIPQLNSEEAEQLRLITEKIGVKKKNQSLRSLIANWHLFIASIEKGYDNSIYEYTNELSIRDIIEDVILLAPLSLKLKLEPVIQYLDAKFHEVTNPISTSVIGHSKSEKLGSWWYRVPNKLLPELRMDLESEGIINYEK